MTQRREQTGGTPSRPFWRNSGWLLADRASRLALGVAVNIALARTLGAADFGRLAAATALAAFFVPLSTLGCERIVVRELARRALDESRVVASLGAVRLAGGALGALLAVGGTWLMGSPGDTGGLLVVALIAAGNLFLASDTVDWAFQARGDFRPTTLARLAAFVLGAAAKLALAAAGAGLAAIAAVVLAEAALAAALQYVVWRRRGGHLDGAGFDAAMVRGLLGAGAPLLAAEIAVWLFQRLDVMLLARLASPPEVGVYAVAQRLAQVGFFLPVLAVQVLSPAVARAEGAEALALVQRAMNGLVWAGVALAAALALGAGPLVRLMFGPDYAPAASVLALLAWSNVFVFMGCAHSLFLVNRGLQAISLRLTWLTAAVSVALNLALIPRWQATGAALASLLTYALTTTLGVGLFPASRPLLGINFRALAAPVVLGWERWRAPRTAASAP